MRTIKTIVLGLLAAAMILVGVANMAPVDLNLLPPALAGEGFSLKGVPLAAVVLAALLAGAVFGQLLEWVRERKQRVTADQKRREVAELRQEIAHLRARLAQKGEDLPQRPAA